MKKPPYDHPYPKIGGSQPTVKTCIANCGKTVVCTDGYGNIPWTYPTIPSSTPYVYSFIKKGYSRIKFKATTKTMRDRPMVTTATPRGTTSPKFGKN